MATENNIIISNNVIIAISFICINIIITTTNIIRIISITTNLNITSAVYQSPVIRHSGIALGHKILSFTCCVHAVV